MYSDAPDISKANSALRNYLGLPPRRGTPPATGRGDIRIGPSRNDILERAVDTLRESPLMRGVIGDLEASGGLRIVMDDTLSNEAQWRSSDRTIRLNPDQIEQARMPVAGIIAFEMSNAYHDETFRGLVDAVGSGDVRTPEDYARKAEQIEYHTAMLRARVVLDMLRKDEWHQSVDPTLRHFLEEGEIIETISGKTVYKLEGDGLWLTFEGYLETQMEVGHTQGYYPRFEKLDKPPEVTRELMIAEAKKKYEERKAIREQQKNLVEASKAVERPSVDATFESGYQSVPNEGLAQFLVPAELKHLQSATDVEVVVRGPKGVWYKRIGGTATKTTFAAYSGH